MTEQELKRVDVRVGLIGALRFMDGSPQGVRQLQMLHSQVCLNQRSQPQRVLKLWDIRTIRYPLLPFTGKVLNASEALGDHVMFHI